MQTTPYSGLDRALHRMAFAGAPVQRILADFEDSFFARSLAPVTMERPVFVTSLPRAGTTLLLEILAALPDFVFHTYRCMPFVMCPLLWNSISRIFRRTGEAAARTHGDGMTIDFDSPEAFEEVFWHSAWPGHYLGDRVKPWSALERKDEFEVFLRNQMRKLAVLGATGESQEPRRARYLSKNNGNIARLPLLKAIFPDCCIVIPFRNPHSHVASLKRQHMLFTELHQRDSFARRYMEYLGHFEFGAALRPIDFGGWCRDLASLDAVEDAYWWRYWVEAYSAVLDEFDRNVILYDYDQACEAPSAALGALGDVLDVKDSSMLQASAGRLRKPTQYDRQSTSKVDPSVELHAMRIHATLAARSINGVGTSSSY